jgi:uncharacterized protein (TIGR02145 family)
MALRPFSLTLLALMCSVGCGRVWYDPVTPDGSIPDAEAGISDSGSDADAASDADGSLPVDGSPGIDAALDAALECGRPVDADGYPYATLQLGAQCWFGENLRVGFWINDRRDQTDTDTVEKYCYGNVEANCETRGGLYQWNEAMGYVTTEGAQGLCPSGWRIPTDGDWKVLEAFLGMPAVDVEMTGFRGTAEGDALATGGSSGFGARLVGTHDGSTFVSDGTDTAFWSSTESATGPSVVARHLAASRSEIDRSEIVKTHALSVRCVR